MKTTQNSTKIKYIAMVLCAIGGILVSSAARADVHVKVINNSDKHALFRLGMVNFWNKYYDNFTYVDTKWLDPGESDVITVPADGRTLSFIKLVDDRGHYYGRTPYTDGAGLYTIADRNSGRFYDASEVRVLNRDYPGPVKVSLWWGDAQGLEFSGGVKLQATLNKGEEKTIMLPIGEAGSPSPTAYLWTDTDEVAFIKRTGTPAHLNVGNYSVTIAGGSDPYQPYDMDVKGP